MTENEISFEIRGCIFKVYNNLDPGLLKSAYEAALGFELNKDAALKVLREQMHCRHFLQRLRCRDLYHGFQGLNADYADVVFTKPHH